MMMRISALDNDSESLKLFYINPNGSEWDYGDWQGTVTQQTFLNHTWVIRSEKTGECIEWFRFVNNYAIDPSMAPFQIFLLVAISIKNLEMI